MNTKPLPAFITLIAAAITCVVSILQGVTFKVFVTRFALVVIIFYVLGVAVRIFLDSGFKVDKEETEKTEEVEKSEETESESDENFNAE